MSMNMSLQGGAQQPSPEDEFERSFSAEASSALSREHPDLVRDVASFRPLDQDADRGSAVGAFILNHNGEVLFIPAVLADNQLKPLDIFYSTRTDRFYPLNTEQLDAVTASSPSRLGETIDTPRHLPTDVNMRHLVVPPLEGRFGYASVDEALARMLERASTTKSASFLNGAWLDYMETAPGAVKTAFAQVFRKHPSLGARVVSIYGKTALAAALAPSAAKTADDSTQRTERPARSDVAIFTSGTPVATLKRELDSHEVARAFAATRGFGFAAVDRRTDLKELRALVENDLQLTEPQTSGRYRLWKADGTPIEATLIVDPLDVDGDRFAWGGRDSRGVRARRLLCVFDDGRYQMLHRAPVGQPILALSPEEIHTELAKRAGDFPSSGAYGMFIGLSGQGLRGTDAFTATDVTTGKNAKTCRVGKYSDATVTVTQHVPGVATAVSECGRHWTLGRGWKWLPCKETEFNNEVRLLHSAKDVLDAIWRAVLDTGAKPVDVKMAADRSFVIGSAPGAFDYIGAIAKVAVDYGLSLGDSLAVIKAAATHDPTPLFAVKTAGDDKKKKSSGGSSGGGGGGGGGEMSPEEAAMQQQAMMAQAAPPPPTGLDLAVAEQMQQLQMQIQALQAQATALQTVQMRAQQIDAGGGAMAAPMGAATMAGGPAPMPPGGGMPMGAPPGQPGMDPSMGGQPGAPPGPPGQPGAPPGQPGMDPSMGGQPGMDPSMGGQPGMDPSMSGQPGMDPSMDAPPPLNAVMSNRDLASNNIEQAINPRFLGQAAELHEMGAFDAAAIASLAKQQSLRGPLESYTVGMDKTLDNLCRVLLLINMKEADLKERIGESYEQTERVLRDVVRGLGDVILQVKRLSADPLQSARRG